MAYMDQYLSLGENDVDEKRRIKDKMMKLVDLFYDALDAPKSGKTVDIPQSLLSRKYPHFMEKYVNKSYNSSSILGEIYDRAITYQPDNALIRGEPVPVLHLCLLYEAFYLIIFFWCVEIWKLQCFNVEIPDPVLNLWNNRYDSYKYEMSTALQSGDESKNNSANIVINNYKKVLDNIKALGCYCLSWVI
ncbi:putative RNA-directed RNA polymerase [Helianthus anomalus]